jgi:hypothetical protein
MRQFNFTIFFFGSVFVAFLICSQDWITVSAFPTPDAAMGVSNSNVRDEVDYDDLGDLFLTEVEDENTVVGEILCAKKNKQKKNIIFLRLICCI